MPIGLWVLRRACADAVGWDRLRVAVNLSVRRLNDLGLVDAVRKALADNGLPARRLEAEITNRPSPTGASRRVLENPAGARRNWRWMTSAPASSLSHLQHFGFDRLKIDRAFIQPCSSLAARRWRCCGR